MPARRIAGTERRSDAGVDEAEQAGAFKEDALSEQDAAESCLDLVDDAAAAFGTAREAT